ncbi:tetratricopeptide repeat protein [Fimbriiglobus ruber]|uniref:Tetratricopeptide repeat protein n=1 Tax=Fimbriiglobus ruber TaxID=1908690 RepID=A0A225DHM2_9BACT|nr:tetratricopeptide repeat protein [Fimbriiglobus ruber]OWK35865.1 tetratricopeptide repeat protein [Fimbriiglobus ruber]
MSAPLLVEFYLKLPQPQIGDDPDLLQAGMRESMNAFRDAVGAKYTEGTLQRLLTSSETSIRRAAALATGLIGTMRSNPHLSGVLRDTDTLVRKFAVESLWEIWFRGGTPDQNGQLQQAIRLPDIAQTLAALDDLVRTAPDFAEAYNQRATLYFRRGEYARSVADCETTLRLNPYHYGAASGMGQSYLRMNRPRAALRAFRQALEINPSIENLRDTIRGLETALDDAAREGGE